MLEAINAHLSGIGECAIITQIDAKRWEACLYLSTRFNNSALVAKWFHESGAKDVIVEHTLYCDLNGDRDGVIENSPCKAWVVTFECDPQFVC